MTKEQELAEIIRRDFHAPCEGGRMCIYPQRQCEDCEAECAASRILNAGYTRPEPLVLKVISDEEIDRIYMEAEIPKAGYVENCKAIMRATAKFQFDTDMKARLIANTNKNPCDYCPYEPQNFKEIRFKDSTRRLPETG